MTSPCSQPYWPICLSPFISIPLQNILTLLFVQIFLYSLKKSFNYCMEQFSATFKTVSSLGNLAHLTIISIVSSLFSSISSLRFRLEKVTFEYSSGSFMTKIGSSYLLYSKSSAIWIDPLIRKMAYFQNSLVKFSKFIAKLLSFFSIDCLRISQTFFYPLERVSKLS